MNTYKLGPDPHSTFREGKAEKVMEDVLNKYLEKYQSDIPSYPPLAGFFRIFLALAHPPAFLKYVFLPAFSETCYSFSLRSLFFLKTYNIFLRNTFKRGCFQSFFALLSYVVASSLKYRLAHSNYLNHQYHTVPKNR